jgi:UDPglucose 6-dehydrogenase
VKPRRLFILYGYNTAASSGLVPLRIATIGCGHVGLITGTCLASLGHTVVCVDEDLPLVARLELGHLPVYEPHLEPLFRQARSAGHLTFTAELRSAIKGADAIFLCVGVPQLESGDSDFSALDRAARQLAQTADGSNLVVIRSTVPVQTGEQLAHLLAAYCGKPGCSFTVAVNPQFLREGTAVVDFFHPERILLGVSDTPSERLLREIYAPLLRQSFRCPIHSGKCPTPAPELFVTRVHSAELIKQVSNAYLATKISYANVLADLCERLGANVQEVTHAVGLDPRIGRLFLQPGLGFGGSRLPADLRAICQLTQQLEIDGGIAEATERVNRERVDVFFQKIQRSMWVLKGKRIALLGLAHKAGTDDVRGSPGLELYERLTTNGASVRAYDPQATGRARALHPTIVCAADAYDAVAQTDALVIATEWDEFRGLDWRRIHSLMARPTVFDGRNLLSPTQMKALGFEYYSVGRPA